MRKTPIKLNEGKIRIALSDPDTPGLVLFTIALYTFGDAVMGDDEAGVEAMDPAEMWSELHTEYGTWMTDEGENKLNAVMTGLRGGMFWRDLDVFMSVATALFDGDLGDLVDVGFESLSATELMWAIMEMGLIWDEDDTPEFAAPVQRYIGEVLAYEQDDQTENANEVEKSYLMMLSQLRELGVPSSIIRAWDEEYADVMENLIEGDI